MEISKRRAKIGVLVILVFSIVFLSLIYFVTKDWPNTFLSLIWFSSYWGELVAMKVALGLLVSYVSWDLIGAGKWLWDSFFIMYGIIFGMVLTHLITSIELARRMRRINKD